MTTLKEKTIQNSTSTLKAKNVVNKLYNLRKAFEADYSGVLRSRKYEETREFTIALNHAIFQANQLLLEDFSDVKNTAQLEVKLHSLKQDFTNLLN